MKASKKDWEKIKWFRAEDFDDPLHPGSGSEIDFGLVRKLDILRELVMGPILIQGAVDVDGKHGHHKNSFHLLKNGAQAVDFHIITRLGPRSQYAKVAALNLGGIGVYYDWYVINERNEKIIIPIGFHIDTRPSSKIQRWARRNGTYSYLLGRDPEKGR